MQLYNSAPESDRAILVGVGVNEILTESDLDELALLAETCNIKTAGRVIQNRKDVDVTFFIGSGKVDEIADLIKQTDANVVIFDVELSGSKVRNLENALSVPVLDRSKVILDIFASRARTAEGKLQVELAQLKYNLPRLVGSGGLMSKMKNSVGMRGPGEKKLELDKRKIRDEILRLESKLADVKKVHQTARAQRGGKPRVCLVGYTNSGKSTLLNTITKAGVYAKDELFATLDTTTRSVYLGDITNTAENPAGGSADRRGAHLSILLTDTVGFINKLPHEFIRAFESTLDETRESDLLLHIVDASNPDRDKQIAVVNDVLTNIGAGSIPQILVYNKIDRLPAPIPNAICVSAKNNIGLDKLKQEIVAKL